MSGKMKGLGRGLDALLSETPQPGESVRAVAVADIDPSRDQPRRAFDPDALAQLADSIRAAGVLQPILVTPEGRRFRIIAGERRFRAARLAGLETIPCIVRDADTSRRLEWALIENIQRQDLNPMEEAAAIRALMDACGLTQDPVSSRLGKSSAAIANLLRLLNLPAKAADWVASGLLSEGHAKVLAGVGDETALLALEQKAIDEGWSVRALESAIEQLSAPQPKPAKPLRALAPELTQLQDSAREAFGLRVQVKGSLKKGSIVLKYESADELERFYDMMETVRSSVLPLPQPHPEPPTPNS